MTAAAIIRLTSLDASRLDRCLRQAAGPVADASAVTELESLPEEALVVPPVEIPADVVTMNSRVVLLSRDHGATRVLTLAYDAAQAAAEHGRVAVTSPLDRALVGQRVGEVIDVDQPGGAHRAWTLLRLPARGGWWQTSSAM
jgi:regulator of nucleoside diphosphate kinase